MREIAAKAGQNFSRQGLTSSGPILEHEFNDCKTSLTKSKETSTEEIPTARISWTVKNFHKVQKLHFPTNTDENASAKTSRHFIEVTDKNKSLDFNGLTEGAPTFFFLI